MPKMSDGSDMERAEPKTWTVMVYMAAGSNTELDATAVQDIREMERGLNGDTHVVVQINRAWPDSFQRYHIRKVDSDPRRSISTLVGVDEKTTNMGDGKTLTKFLEWAADKFPAEHYFLVLWGHAYGLGFGRDHNDPLKLSELKSALDGFSAARLALIDQVPALAAKLTDNQGRLEVLGANACAMSYVEAAYELRNSACYLLASQISVPFAGWPYESILKRVDDNTTPKEFGIQVVNTYVSHFNGLVRGERVSMTLVDLSLMEKMKGLIRTFATEIKNDAVVDGSFNSRRLDFTRDVFLSTAVGDVRPLIDLTDLCKNFKDAESEPLRAVAGEIETLLASIVVHHCTHPDLEDLKGIGIFAPFVTDDADLERLQLQDIPRNGTSETNGKHATGRQEYESLSIFAGDGGRAWPGLVYDDLRKEISTELITTIGGIDATSVQDRRDLTQMILAIDSAFNKLDRILAAAREHVDKKRRHGVDGWLFEMQASPRSDKKKFFGPPFLKLIQPITIETQVETLKQRLELKRLQEAANGQTVASAAVAPASQKPLGPALALSTQTAVVPTAPKMGTTMSGLNINQDVVNTVVQFFQKVELAIGGIERAARRGLTHPKLGLGPLGPKQFSLDELSRPRLNVEGPKSGFNFEPPKSGFNFESPKSGFGDQSNGDVPLIAVGGDLRVDMALARVTDLFRQVGQSLRDLEQAALDVESTARSVLDDEQVQNMPLADLVDAALQEIRRAFQLLDEASTTARRTVRRVLSHPVYGLGPGSSGLGLEERQALATAGGLDRRSLRLL